MRCEVDDIASLIRSSAESLPEVKIQHSDFEEVKHNEVTIINEMWECPGLRKVHLEVAKTKHLDVLHCVFFPDPRYNLPIFGADIIATPTVMTAAIVDVSPITGGEYIYDKIKIISDNFTFKEPRPLPEWADIFSPYMKFQRIREDIEKVHFYQVVMEYLIIYCDAVKNAKRGSMEETYNRYQEQCRYSTQQRKNPKTIAVLSNWFDREWADNYINDILFCKPKPMLTL